MSYNDKAFLVGFLSFLFAVVWLFFSILLSMICGPIVFILLAPAGWYGIYVVSNALLK